MVAIGKKERCELTHICEKHEFTHLRFSGILAAERM
jgi:hypothetical protein